MMTLCMLITTLTKGSRGGGYEEKGWKMACNWVVMRSSHCPYLVRIESNADFLSRFYGWLENQPHPDCVTTMLVVYQRPKIGWDLGSQPRDLRSQPPGSGSAVLSIGSRIRGVLDNKTTLKCLWNEKLRYWKKGEFERPLKVNKNGVFLFVISHLVPEIIKYCIMQIRYWWRHKVWQYGSQNTK